LILVIIYILTIFFGKDWFSISELGIFFTLLGTIWLFFSIKQLSWKKSFQPIILIIIGFISIQQDSILVLKSFPLTISTLFFLAFIHAEVTKEYFLVKYIEKFKKLDNKERIYLEKTHLIWVVVTAINVSLHSYFLFFGSIEEWTLYSTVGWYILLGCGILFQIAFRRFYEKSTN